MNEIIIKEEEKEIKEIKKEENISISISHNENKENKENEKEEKKENVIDIIDSSPRGGDEDMLEGTEIKNSNKFEDNWSDSSSEEEDSDIIFHTCSASTNQRRFEKSSNAFNRSEGTKASRETDSKAPSENPETSSEALKPLRFSYHRTAFDVDIDELDETPWREHHTDISDYFNYGFSETTWNLYCAKQLKIRAERGEGPSVSTPQPPPLPASIPVPSPSTHIPVPIPVPVPVPQPNDSNINFPTSTSTSGGVPSQSSPAIPVSVPVPIPPVNHQFHHNQSSISPSVEMQSAMFLNQLQNTIHPSMMPPPQSMYPQVPPQHQPQGMYHSHSQHSQHSQHQSHHSHHSHHAPPHYSDHRYSQQDERSSKRTRYQP